MKLIIPKKPLLEGLDLVKDAISKNGSLPILKNVKINAEGEGLYLYTTNLNTGFKAWVREANIIEPGIALCDALKLLSIVKELPDAEIIVSTEENGHVRVECANVSFKLIGMSAEDYPAEITPSDPDTHAIGQDFFSALLKVRHAASREDSRYNLNGIYLNGEIVATDGHRLSLARQSQPLQRRHCPLGVCQHDLKVKEERKPELHALQDRKHDLLLLRGPDHLQQADRRIISGLQTGDPRDS